MRTYSLPCRAANQWPRRQSLTTTEEAVAAESRVAPRSFCRVVKEGLETFWRWDSLPCTRRHEDGRMVEGQLVEAMTKQRPEDGKAAN
uniref:Uncharacterized protein n=1 Tax=Chromera velia CCMP2878 TaxID=1169474 RepID=A0A0G4HSY0_9ALVE|eukprot:Cvel_8326.t1-p1 / transcript=Cvel_8326.t1 / gene=Cvel_8326 / organism=Chromera_velia_CCMP2878 / gene_product=hypothetical protein / transcript_product=hypothetical protein / location=Cvel_scaffold458:3592-5298(-) / protein_length=87 / sequence_SO=supercontig / SO=protein_coding / is_pseudo=false